MTTEQFLLKDRVKEIESNFLKNGWLTVYSSNPEPLDKDQRLVFCCLVEQAQVSDYLQDSDWVVEPGSEGKPAVWGDGTYETHSDKGFEPFLFVKRFNFSDGHESYIDISEEFVLYYRLYEKGTDKNDRKFYFIDDAGDLDEVISIQHREVKVKMKYIIEYISIRKMNFAIMFDFMRLAKLTDGVDAKAQDETYKGDNFYYTHLIRGTPWVDGSRLQSWIHGKLVIRPDAKKQKGYHFDYENQPYESFITGYDDKGNEVLQDCKRTNEKYFIVTYFKKEVLNKYYNDPTKYTVDGFHVQSSFFTLKIDNNIDEYVAVFLVELGTLPHKEQLHWKQYNIPPQKGISSTYYKTMIEGSWAEHPETPDLYFKHKFQQFNEKWQSTFGWPFYKPLSKEDEHIFTSLHIPTTNNIKSFCEQILSLIKITIDRLNEAEFSKAVTMENGERGISKLEKFLKARNVELPDMINFLRSLWDLRSGLLAHSFSTSNDKCKKAMKYFKIDESTYVEVARDIFTKSIHTLNTLETLLLNSEQDK